MDGLGIGWTELLLIGIVALIVIGPQDLPDMFRQLGRITGKLRAMAREFSRAMDQAAKESGATDAMKDVKNMTSAQSTGLSAVKSAADKFEKWDPLKNAAKPTGTAGTGTAGTKPLTPPPMPATPPQVSAASESTLTSVAARDAEQAAATPGPSTPGPSTPGPATQALMDKKAARAAVLAETAQKLKAIDAGTLPAADIPAPKAKKPKAPKPAAAAPKEADK